jgi:hypothetical protein
MMTKKPRRNPAIGVSLHPIVAEIPLPRDPLNVRIVKRELHRLEHRIIEKHGDITALRSMLTSSTTEELWEVPG